MRVFYARFGDTAPLRNPTTGRIVLDAFGNPTLLGGWWEVWRHLDETRPIATTVRGLTVFDYPVLKYEIVPFGDPDYRVRPEIFHAEETPFSPANGFVSRDWVIASQFADSRQSSHWTHPLVPTRGSLSNFTALIGGTGGDDNMEVGSFTPTNGYLVLCNVIMAGLSTVAAITHTGASALGLTAQGTTQAAGSGICTGLKKDFKGVATSGSAVTDLVFVGTNNIRGAFLIGQMGGQHATPVPDDTTAVNGGGGSENATLTLDFTPGTGEGVVVHTHQNNIYAITAAGGYAEVGEQSTSAGNNDCLVHSMFDITSPGTTPSATWTGSGNAEWEQRAMQIAVAADAGGGLLPPPNPLRHHILR